jgi:hypothetical protein
MKDVHKRFGNTNLIVESWTDGAGHHMPGGKMPLDLTPLLQQEPSDEAYHLRVWLVDNKMRPSWRSDEFAISSPSETSSGQEAEAPVLRKTPPSTPSSPLISVVPVETSSKDSGVSFGEDPLTEKNSLTSSQGGSSSPSYVSKAPPPITTSFSTKFQDAGYTPEEVPTSLSRTPVNVPNFPWATNGTEYVACNFFCFALGPLL